MINDIIQLLGIANPQLSMKWSGGIGTVFSYDGTFGLTFTGNDSFVAPANGILNKDVGLERIIMPDGSMPANAIILKIDPQVYLRLTRMYATQIEGTTGNGTFLTERPVPLYFVYTGTTGIIPAGGFVLAGDSLAINGTLTIHDRFGFPIDPLAVASAFNVFVQTFATMARKPLNSASKAAPVDTNPQISVIAGLAGTVRTTIHLLSPNGVSYPTGDKTFNNLAPINNGTEGLYRILNTAVDIDKIAPGDDTKIGAATNGLMDDRYRVLPLNLNPALTLPRDFLRAYVIPLRSYLLGTEDPNALQYNVGATVNDNEQITLLINGNECFKAVDNITASLPPLTLVASPVIESDFVLPLANANESWPAFPVPGGMLGSAVAIPANMKNNFVIAARFITDTQTKNADVLVTLSCSQFTPGDAVRIYNRLFNETDGTESRGNGAGAIINNTNTVLFRLKDPFNQVNGIGHFNAVSNPVLMLDVLLVNRGMFKRTFGNVQCGVDADQPLTGPEIALLTNTGNNLNQAAERGISPAGISGTSTNVLAGAGVLDVIGEDQPRNAPRYPTMARYDSMAASLTPGGPWQAFCGGTVFKKDALNNFPLMGNPGSPGGIEYSSVGVFTQGGVLAYDIARAAYRRTRNIVERMINFIAANANNWNTPAAPAAGALNTWAAATLQTIAPHCETPEIGLAFDMTDLPANWPAFVTQVQSATVGNPLPSWIPVTLQGRLQTAINTQAADPQFQRAYDELRREFVSSLYGRRDTYGSLINALNNARECIYIQGTFLNHTAYPGDSGIDILGILKGLMITAPRLKLIICLGKPIHYGKGYEQFEARDYKARMDAIEDLQGPVINGVRANAHRVLAFHPAGFPMRPKVLQHQVVIVDDMWALVGSSTIRRRGLAFDGSQDMVMVDKKITNGKSAGIKNFRIRLMQEHLNLQRNTGLVPGLQVRLNDLHDAFFAIKELLDSGGAGLITPIWGGDRQDLTSLPEDDLADPGSTSFMTGEALLTIALNQLSTTPA